MEKKIHQASEWIRQVFDDPCHALNWHVINCFTQANLSLCKRICDVVIDIKVKQIVDDVLSKANVTERMCIDDLKLVSNIDAMLPFRLNLIDPLLVPHLDVHFKYLNHRL